MCVKQVVELIWLNINPAKKEFFFSGDPLSQPFSQPVHIPGWVSTVQDNERTGMKGRVWMQLAEFATEGSINQSHRSVLSLPEYALEQSDATHCFPEGSVSMD